MEKEEAEGYEAYKRLWGLIANPYDCGASDQISKYASWRQGWLKAEKEDGK